MSPKVTVKVKKQDKYWRTYYLVRQGPLSVVAYFREFVYQAEALQLKRDIEELLRKGVDPLQYYGGGYLHTNYVETPYKGG